MMTEAEAREKRCCSPGAGNGPVLWYCIASECMAWRWGKGEVAMPTDDRGALGYCGLGGKP